MEEAGICDVRPVRPTWAFQLPGAGPHTVNTWHLPWGLAKEGSCSNIDREHKMSLDSSKPQARAGWLWHSSSGPDGITGPS